jgi:plasmid stabilization system protein ParE
VSRSIHRFADEDLTEAFRFYKREGGSGLAARFLNEFERVARLLEQYPRFGTPTEDGRYAYPLVDFPYSVIYSERDGEIRILVLRHQHRDPEYGEARR